MFEILKNQSVISISGLDAQKFLQSLTTNDIINNSYSHNYLLNNQGRYLFDFFVHTNEDNSFLLEICNVRANDLIKYFNLYKLRSNVMITDCSLIYKVIYSTEEFRKYVVKSNQDPRYEKLGFRSIVKMEKIRDLGRGVDNLYLEDKYKYSVPDGNIDLTFEKSIPLEYGADELGSISYTKGCYIGQEIISRTKYQGVVRKKIYHISSAGDNLIALRDNEIIDLKGNKIGIICSFYNTKGIALLREELVLAMQEKVAMIDNTRIEIEIPSWRR